MADNAETMCPIRIGDPCSLCHPGASDPQSCGLVYLVMSDPELREELLRRWQRWEEEEARRTSEEPGRATTPSAAPTEAADQATSVRPAR